MRSDAFAVLTVGVDAGIPWDGATDVAAGAAVLQACLKIDADACAATQTGCALSWWLFTRAVDAALAGGTGGIALPAVVRIVFEVDTNVATAPEATQAFA